MDAIDGHELAAELRDTARDLRLCLVELLAEDSTLLADVLRRFPNRIDSMANRLAGRLVAKYLPEWPEMNEPCEAHFAVLLRRLHWLSHNRS